MRIPEGKPPETSFAGPPRFAQALLEQLLSEAEQDELLGNLEEHFWRHVEINGLRAARSWYRRQAVGVILRWPQLRKRTRVQTPHASRADGRRREDMAMGILIRDLRFGLRTLWKNKSFSLSIVLTLALAIGANTTIFSMVSALILQPAPFSNQEEVTFFWMSHPESNRPRVPLSVRDYLDLTQRLTTFQGISALRFENLSLRTSDGTAPVRLSGVHASTNFFPLMGVELVEGRNFLPEESKAGHERVAILAHKTWKSRFGADEVLEQEIFLDGVSHRIIGVLTPEMETGVFQEAEIWLPLVTDVTGPESERRALMAISRLKADQTLETAREEAAAVMGRLAEDYPARFQGYRAEVLSLSEALFGQNGRIALAVLVVSVSFVLIIACSNVANLILARSLSRRGEIALRTALGASRMRILRQLLTESLILSGLGAVLGIAIAYSTLRLLVWISQGQGFFVSFSINRDVLLFALALGLLTPLIFGLVPGLRITRKDLVGDLKEGRGMAATGRLFGQKAMVAGQVVLSFIMLVMAGLATRSVSQLAQIPLGFEPEQVVTFQLDVPNSTLEDLNGRVIFQSRLREELLSIPGVESASFSSHRPLGGGRQSQLIQIPGVLEPDPDRQPAVFLERVGPDYFSILQVPILQGREFRTADREGRRAMIISEAAWAQHWKRDEAVGSTVLLGNDPSPWQVVGIVGNQRNPDADQPPLPLAYLPFAEDVPANFSVFIRSPLEAGSLLPAVRREIARLAPDTPIYDTQALQEIVYADQATDYAVIALMNFFSLTALGLAAAGIYAMTAFSVNRRLHEFGIRTAMGALPGDLIRLAVKESLTPLLIGVGLGLLAAFFASQLISGALYGVAPGDPLIFGTVVVGLLGLGSLASLLPTLRAVRKDLVNRLRA